MLVSGYRKNEATSVSLFGQISQWSRRAIVRSLTFDIPSDGEQTLISGRALESG
jgi:hypothetical protein